MDTEEISRFLKAHLVEIARDKSFSAQPTPKRLVAIRNVVMARMKAELAYRAYQVDMGTLEPSKETRLPKFDLNDRYFELLTALAEVNLDKLMDQYALCT